MTVPLVHCPVCAAEGSLATTPVTAAAAPPPAADTFVGRVHEQHILRARLAAAQAGTPHVVLLVGEPGIGKTRLARECAGAARAAGATVVWGVCTEDAGMPPYWLWQQILRGIAASGPQPAAALWQGPHATDLSTLVPDLGAPARTGAPAEHAPLAAEDARVVLGAGIVEVLASAARDQPLVLILDDLHAADVPSLQVLHVVVRSFAAERVLVLGSYRDADLERLPEHRRLLYEVARRGELLPLHGLSVDEVADYLRGTLPAPAPNDLAAVLQAHTGGNPLFVQELTRRLVAERRLGPGAALDLRAVRTPDGARGAIRERLSPLSPNCRAVLSVAAVIGDGFARPLLGAAAGTSALGLDEALHEAVAAGLVAPQPGSAAAFCFVHPLIRETLYQDLASTRIALHRRVADALKGLPGHDPDQHDSAIAHHAWRAAPDGHVEDAIVYSCRAAERALSRWAYEDAIEHYQHALEALDLGSTPAPRRRCELLLALGAAQHAAGDPAARQAFETAARSARALADAGDPAGPGLLADAALGVANRGIGHLHSTPDAAAAAGLEEALARVPASVDRSRRALVLGRLALEAAARREEARSLAFSAEAEQLARGAGEPHALATVLSDRYAVLWSFNHVGDRLKLASEVLDLAVDAGARDLALRGRGWRLIELMTVGDVAAFDEELRRYDADAALLQQPRYDWVAANARALRALWAGRWDDAESAMATALGLSQQGGDQTLLIAAAVQRFVLQRERGASAAAEPAARAFAAQFSASPIPRCFLGIIALDDGRLDAAAAELAVLADGRFAGVRRERRIGLLPLLVELVVALDAADLAAPLEELLAEYAPYHVLYGPVVDFGACSRYLAQLAAVRGDRTRAERYFDDALQRNAAAHGRPMLAWTQFDYATSLLRTETWKGTTGTRTAAELLAAARATAASLGMVRLQQRLEVLPVAPRVSVPVGVEKPVGGVFRCDGDVWTIGDDVGLTRLKDSKGLRYLAQLLRHPGRELTATELAFGPDGGAMATDAGEPVLDAAARAAYQRRLRELREELDDAEASNDLGRASALRTELEYLTDELARAAGLRGRTRRTGSAAERARLNVTRAIKTAIQHITAHVPTLGRYLETTVHTGRLCGYTPDARLPITFDLGEP